MAKESQASTRAVADAEFHAQDGRVQSATNIIGGAINDITVTLLAVVVPMVTLTIVFVAFVVTYQLPTAVDSFENLASPVDVYDNSAYYINLSATRLITISSWTSTAASLISSFAAALLLYPLARSYLINSQTLRAKALFSPYQLQLFLGLTTMSLGSVWSWLRYSFWKHRSKQPLLLKLSAVGCLVIMILGYAIFAADTWLHVTTSTVPYDRVQALSTPSYQFGRELSPVCYESPVAEGTPAGLLAPPDPCSNSLTSPMGVILQGASEAYETLTNTSSTNTILPCSIGNKRLAYLADARSTSELDFEATTFAVGNTCQPMSQACNLTAGTICPDDQIQCFSAEQLAPTLTYNCSQGVSGDLLTEFYFPAVYMDPKFNTEALFSGDNDTFRDAINPSLYVAFGGYGTTTDQMTQDPEAVALTSNPTERAILVSCKLDVYLLQYRFSRGAFKDGNLTPANSSLVKSVGFPLRWVSDFPRTALQSAFFRQALVSESAQQLADSFAQSLSETALGMIAGTTRPQNNFAEQGRQHLLVARLPKRPFYALVGLNIVYVLAGLSLGIVAYSLQPTRTRNAQAQLNVAGLVATLFESDRHDGASLESEMSGVDGLFRERFEEDDSRVALAVNEHGKLVFMRVNGTAYHDDSNGDVDGDEIEDEREDGEQNVETPPPK